MKDIKKLQLLLDIECKCEQYFNEMEITHEEIHAILEFIHSRILELKDDLL